MCGESERIEKCVSDRVFGYFELFNKSDSSELVND
jgi:hypothetical protein